MQGNLTAVTALFLISAPPQANVNGVLIKMSLDEYKKKRDFKKTEAGQNLAIEMGYKKNYNVHLMSNGKKLSLK